MYLIFELARKIWQIVFVLFECGHGIRQLRRRNQKLSRFDKTGEYDPHLVRDVGSVTSSDGLQTGRNK